MKRDAVATEGGFTLIELLVVVALLGFVVAPISAAIVVGLRTTSATANRITSSHDAQLVSTYLPADLQSVGSAAGDVNLAATVTSHCPGAPPQNVLQLHWSQQTDGAGSTTNYYAQYVVAQAGANTGNHNQGDWELTRYYCGVDAQGQTIAPSQTILARNLNGAGAAVITPNPPNGPKITMTVTGLTATNDPPYVFSVSGYRRTP